MAKQVAVVINETLATAISAAKDVITAYGERGVRFSAIHPVHSEILDIPLIEGLEDTELIVSFGGDGTILRSAKLSGYADVPILGVNLGKLGFLSGATKVTMYEALDASLGGRAVIEPRNLVQVNILKESTIKELGLALNEVVIGRGFGEPTVTTSLEINGHKIYTSSGDGIIVATATGSTAYAMSAGGPIMSPDYDGLVIVTLASHTLVQRAIVTGNNDKVTINLPDKRRAKIEMVLDGEQIEIDGAIDAVSCNVSDKTVKLVKLESRRFYDTVATEFFS